MSSLFDQLFNCCEYKDCNISNFSYEQGTRTNSKGIVTTTHNNGNANNINKSISEEAKKKYSFIISSNSQNESMNNNSKLSNNFFNKSNFDVSPIDRSINEDNLNKEHSNSDSLIFNSFNNTSTFFNKNFRLTDNIIVDEDIEYSPKLRLVAEHKSNDIFFGKELKIDAAGEETSLRNQRDGITIFGILKQNQATPLSTPSNGIDIPINLETIVPNNEIQKVFAIEYSKVDSNYYIHNIYKIKDNTIKQKQLLLYIKINHEYQLTPCINLLQNQTASPIVVYILIGALLSVFSISIMTNEIGVKIYNEKGKDVMVEKSFIREEGRNCFVIGREGCDVNVEHKSVSKVHCTVSFNEYQNYWVIEDGNGKGKHSGNGTWLVLGYKGKFKLSMVEDKYCVKVLNKMFTVEINH